MPNRVATQDEQRQTRSPALVEVVCEGSPREMGYSQGAGLREKIETACRTLTELEAFRLKQPWWMPYPLYYKLAQRRARQFLQHALSDSFTHASQRLAGISEGSAFGLDTLSLLNALEPVLSSVQD